MEEGGVWSLHRFHQRRLLCLSFYFFILAFIFFKVINAHSLTSQMFLKDFPFHSLEKPFPIPLTAPFSIYSISPKNMLTKLIVILHF